MSKKNVMISIDEFIHKRAKEKFINVSEICEDALRRRVKGEIKDVPEENLKLQCSKCLKIVEFGFLCEELNKFYCEECENGYFCPIRKEHQHLRIPGLDGQNIELLKKVAENSSKCENA
jgi:hypothetical protein